MKRWRWLQRDIVISVHEQQLAEHGGGAGVRDAGLLESALARPEVGSPGTELEFAL